MNAARTYVLGLGNVLMGDDGFGPAAVRAFLERYDVGPEVEVIDLGTPGLDLTPWLVDTHHVIFVDTVKASLPPGSMRIYDKADLTKHAPFARTGPHDPGVKECVFTLEFAGRAPSHITIVGVVPDFVGMSIELSTAVSAAVPAAVEAIADALRQHGDEVVPRLPGALLGAAPWWQAGVPNSELRSSNSEPSSTSSSGHTTFSPASARSGAESGWSTSDRRTGRPRRRP